MDQDMNPLLPGGFDLAWQLLALVTLVVSLVAIVLILLSSRYTLGGKALWILAVISLPLLGAVAWFLTGRTARLRTDVP